MQDLDLEKILEENERLKKENQKLKKMLKNLESKDNLNYFLQNNKEDSSYDNVYKHRNDGNSEDMSIISFLARSDKRVQILKSLSQGDKIPSKIGKEIGDSSHHVSKYLTSLKEKELVICLNEEDKRYRFYRITEKGKHYLKIIENKQY